MKTWTEKMLTRCAGRYLIDLPASFVLNQVHRTTLEQVVVDVEPMTEVAFTQVFETREIELQRETIHGHTTKSLLGITKLPSARGAVFNRSEDRSTNLLRTLELLGWRNGYKFAMTLDALDMSFSTMKVEGDTRRTDVPEKLAHLLDIFERTRGLREGEVPTEPGVCIRHGFVRGPASDREDVLTHFRLEGAEDVGFSLHTIGDLKQDNELLDRGAAIEANLKTVAGRTLRKGKLERDGLRAQEWLLTRPGDQGVMLYDFTLEANSKVASAKTPVLILDMLVGSRVAMPPMSLEEVSKQKPLTKATLSEAESIALWDAVAPTVRPRPGAF